MPHRCAFGCKNTAVEMHAFPNPKKFPERFITWVTLVGGKLETLSDFECYKKKKICDIHFTDKDRNRYKRLNALSVPSLHLPGSPVTPMIISESQAADTEFPTIASTDPKDHTYSSKWPRPYHDHTYSQLQSEPALHHYRETFTGVALHRFPNPSLPKEIERFRTWVMKIGGDIAGEDNLFIHNNRRICHRHFEDVFTFPNNRLTGLAIPTLHIPGVHVGPLRRPLDEKRALPSLLLPEPQAMSTRPVDYQAPEAKPSTCKASSKYGKDDTILHSFPNPDKDLDRYLSWIQAVGSPISSLEPHYVYQKRRICHDHFETKYLTWTRRLSRSAVPTLFLPGTNKSKQAGGTEAVANRGDEADAKKGDGAAVIEGPSEQGDDPATGSDGSLVEHEDAAQEQISPASSPDRDLSPVRVIAPADDVKRRYYKCSECKCNITGFRYACVQCDWQLCSECEGEGAHAAHYLLRAPRLRPHNETERVIEMVRSELKALLAAQESTAADVDFTELAEEIKEEEEDSLPDPLECLDPEMCKESYDETMLNIGDYIEKNSKQMADESDVDTTTETAPEWLTGLPWRAEFQPQTSIVVPHTTTSVPQTMRTALHATKSVLQATSSVPQSMRTVLMAKTSVPQTTRTVLQARTLVPQTTTTVPQTTRTVRQTTTTVPQAATTVPQATTTVPQTTRSVPQATTIDKPVLKRYIMKKVSRPITDQPVVVLNRSDLNAGTELKVTGLVYHSSSSEEGTRIADVSDERVKRRKKS